MRLVAALLAFAIASVAQAQAWPSKPVRLIVGPGPDTIARLVAQKLGEVIGQPVLVDQRGGGAGSVSAEVVAKSPPDGYTLLLATGTHLIGPLLSKLPYDMLRDFMPVNLVAGMPFVLAVHPSVPAKTVAELVALAKAQPGKLNFGSGGEGSPPHLTGELFKSMAGIELVHVPYKTVAAAVIELVGGQIQVMFANGQLGVPQIRAGRLRGLAVTTRERSPALPELPTMIELGYAGFEVVGWNGILAPAGTPAAIVERLDQSLQRVVAAEDVRTRLADIGLAPIGTNAAGFGAFLVEETERWAKVVKAAGLRKND